MSGLAVVLTATPGTGGELQPYDVSPGLIGFLVTAAVVVVVILLMRNMTGRMRRLERRPEPGDADETPGEPTDRPEDGAGPAGGDAPRPTDRT